MMMIPTARPPKTMMRDAQAREFFQVGRVVFLPAGQRNRLLVMSAAPVI